MEIRQRRYSNKTLFEYGDDALKYTIEDKGGAGDLEIHYAEIPWQSSMKEERSDWLRNLGLIWLALGAFQLGNALLEDTPAPVDGLWLMVGLVCLAAYRLVTTRYSVFATDKGPIYVIRDNKHDEIVETISQHRKQQLLSWYGEVNPDNDLEQEIAKFRWLSDQDVMSKEEAERKIAQAEIMYKENYELPGERPIH